MQTRALLEAMRPRQWTKNLFVLTPVLFGRAATRPEALQRSILAALAFCGVASALYLVNDVFDRKADRQHPVKRRRPIASGRVSVGVALAASGVLLSLSLLLAGFGVQAALPMLLGYGAGMVLYSAFLKRVALLDVLVISSGFVLRVVAGAAAASVKPSHWLLLCTFFLALFLALSKRRGERATSGSLGRASLDAVPASLLDSFQNVALGTTIVSYALYTVAPETVARHGSDSLLLTVPFVVFGLFRWRLLEVRGGGEDPASDLLSDPVLLLTVLLWGASCIALVYFAGAGPLYDGTSR